MLRGVRAHAVRVLGVVAAVLPLLTAVWPDVPWEACVLSAAALLGAGEVVQQVENRRVSRLVAELEKRQSKG